MGFRGFCYCVWLYAVSQPGLLQAQAAAGAAPLAPPPPSAAPLAPPPPSAAPLAPPPPSAAPLAPPPPSAAPSPAAVGGSDTASQPAPGVDAQPPAETPAPAAPPPTTAPPARRAHDAERPPNDAPVVHDGRGFVGRLLLGVEGSLWATSEGVAQSKPVFLNLDLGYAFTRRFAWVVRVGGWLGSGSPPLDYLGTGVTHYFAWERMFVTGTVGLSLLRTGASTDLKQYTTGLAGQFDIGQLWHLTTATEFAVGAHFELGTPWPSNGFTTMGAGLFASLGLR